MAVQDINRVTISGRLTRDIEVRTTNGGTAVGGIAIASNDRVYHKQTGEWGEYTNFVDGVIFGSRAESLRPYLLKGRKVCVSGKLRYSSWEKDGQRRSKIEIVVDDLVFMSGEKHEEQREQYDGPGTLDYDLPF